MKNIMHKLAEDIDIYDMCVYKKENNERLEVVNLRESICGNYLINIINKYKYNKCDLIIIKGKCEFRDFKINEILK